MEKVILNKRVFQQETRMDSRYLLLPAEEISKYIELGEYIGIPHGEILHPNKWLYFGKNAPKVIPKEEFRYSDYEYVFYPDNPLLKEFQELATANDLVIHIGGNTENMLEIEELPFEMEGKLKVILEQEVITENELLVVEAFPYENEGNTHFLVLDSQTTDDEISYEYTNDFQKLHLVSSFQREVEGQEEYIFKTLPESHTNRGNLYNTTSERWFHLSLEQKYQVPVLVELYGIEDILSFTAFTEKTV